MSEENVEIVRRIYELFNRRDDAALSAVLGGHLRRRRGLPF
jgi:hypothetical protein